MSKKTADTATAMKSTAKTTAKGKTALAPDKSSATNTPTTKQAATKVTKVTLKQELSPPTSALSRKATAAAAAKANTGEVETPSPSKPSRATTSGALKSSPKANKAVENVTNIPPAPPAATSRFADRFAPRPPSRQVQDVNLEANRQVHFADPVLANAWKTKAGSQLTEAELHAMPESEYMNDKQLEFFRARLQTQKDNLLSNAGETTEHLREDTSIVPDPADRATIEEEHALELRTRDRERKLLKKISQSLTRIESREYGFCDETGEPIGLGRLIARPTATLSLEAQQRRELKQKMFGD